MEETSLGTLCDNLAGGRRCAAPRARRQEIRRLSVRTHEHRWLEGSNRNHAQATGMVSAECDRDVASGGQSQTVKVSLYARQRQQQQQQAQRWRRGWQKRMKKAPEYLQGFDRRNASECKCATMWCGRATKGARAVRLLEKRDWNEEGWTRSGDAEDKTGPGKKAGRAGGGRRPGKEKES